MALESRQGFLLGGGLPAMLWMLWPRWLTGKGLPLLGAVLLRKREKQGPQWKQWQVKYLIFPGLWTGGVLEVAPCED